MGSSIGVSLLGAIYASHLTSTLSSAGGPGGAASVPDGASGMTPAILDKLPGAVQELFKQAVTNGTDAIFVWAVLIAAVGSVISWFLTVVPLRETVTPTSEKVAESVEELAI